MKLVISTILGNFRPGLVTTLEDAQAHALAIFCVTVRLLVSSFYWEANPLKPTRTEMSTSMHVIHEILLPSSIFPWHLLHNRAWNVKV